MKIENPSNYIDGSELRKKKASYFSSFALHHMEDMRILAKGGILGKEGEGWRNISEHCLAEAVVADILAESLGAKRDNVVKAALLHDWYKRREIEAMDEYGGNIGYQTTIGEDKKKLKKYGVSDEIIALAHANIPTKYDEEYLKSRVLEEKIVHFADHIVQGSEIVDFNDRLRSVEKKKQNIEFSDSFREKYNGKSLFDLQYKKVCPMEQKEFEEKLGLKGGILLDFIRKKLKERINKE